MKHLGNVKLGDGLRTFFAIVLLFFVFSFFGWCMEKLTFLIAFGQNADRGFLRLPFCTIYGGSLAVIRLIFGVPLAKERAYPWNMLSLIFYAAGAALVATAAELLIGVFFHDVFGLRLWTYSGYPHQYNGYICLPMSVAWGGLITVAMATLWAPAERAAKRLPVVALISADAVLTVTLTIDFIYCLFAVL